MKILYYLLMFPSVRTSQKKHFIWFKCMKEEETVIYLEMYQVSSLSLWKVCPKCHCLIFQLHLQRVSQNLLWAGLEKTELPWAWMHLTCTLGVAQVQSLPSMKGAMQKPALTSEEGWRHVWFAVVAMVSVSVLSTQAQKAAKTRGVDWRRKG